MLPFYPLNLITPRSLPISLGCSYFRRKTSTSDASGSCLCLSFSKMISESQLKYDVSFPSGWFVILVSGLNWIRFSYDLIHDSTAVQKKYLIHSMFLIVVAVDLREKLRGVRTPGGSSDHIGRLGDAPSYRLSTNILGLATIHEWRNIMPLTHPYFTSVNPC